MSIICTVSISPWSNQLHRLLFASSRFPGGRSSQLLQFRQMDSCVSSANTHNGALIENSHDRDHRSDMIMVGDITVYLNRKRYEGKSSSLSSVNKCDAFELGSERKRTPANVPNSYHDDEFQPVCRQITKRRSRIDLELERSNNTTSLQVEGSPLLNNNSQQDESSLPLQFGKKNEPFCIQKRQSMDIDSKNSLVMDNLHPFEPLDISPYERSNAKPRAHWQVKGRGEFPPVSRQDTKRRSCRDLGFERSNNTSSFQVKGSSLNNSSQLDESSQPKQFGKKNQPFYVPKRQSMDISSKNSLVMDNLHPFEPFDICPYERRGNAKPGAHWQFKGRDTVKVMERVADTTNYRVLRPGMVLLKHYITLQEQVNIVRTCQELGVGPGGFYRPGYKDGAKLKLQMMCLGLDWDPQTRKYGDKRAVDGVKAPDIPPKFAILVTEALKHAHALIKNKCNKSNIESILPSMSPDICIVNFYTTSGRLGLHQDRDESKESLVSGLPVVSFSLGDSAEFLYGDRRDIDKAEKVVLESGDVLIFGGESRHIFHGVSSIIPKSTPQCLLDHTGLHPGRLNLTFRKY